MPSDTSSWLRELGAERPMTVASDECLVLGKWCDWLHPITWCSKRVGPGKREETWFIFGLKVEGPVTKEDCQRILSQLKEPDPGIRNRTCKT
jgi:hypothetical protein